MFWVPFWTHDRPSAKERGEGVAAPRPIILFAIHDFNTILPILRWYLMGDGILNFGFNLGVFVFLSKMKIVQIGKNKIFGPIIFYHNSDLEFFVLRILILHKGNLRVCARDTVTHHTRTRLDDPVTVEWIFYGTVSFPVVTIYSPELYCTWYMI